MNAKKIMGAVLVALLAAALFVGAGAAAVTDGQTVFVNQKVPGLTGTWTSGTNSITAQAEGGDGYFTGSIVEGVYVNGTGNNAISINVKYPAISVVGVANNGVTGAEYLFIGGTYYIGSTPVNIQVNSPADLTFDKIYLTLPSGEEIQATSGLSTTSGTIAEILVTAPVAVGEYSIRAVYKAADFATGTFVTDLITKPVTFKVAEAGDVTISASVDQVLKSEPFTVKVTGQPGKEYAVKFDLDAFDIKTTQIGFTGAGTVNVGDDTTNEVSTLTFTMPNTGFVEFVVKAEKAGDSEKLTAQLHNVPNPKTASVTVKFNKGTISANTDAASYFVGDKVAVSGTSTDGTIVNMSIKGTNFQSVVMTNGVWATQLAGTDAIEYGSEVAKTFEFEFETSKILNEKDGFKGKKMDVGTYTLTIETASAKATVPVVLKQPFISIVEAPEVIVQKTDAEFIINAEASPKGIAYYIFGTNYFANGVQDVADEDTTNQFTIELNEDDTAAMAAGQYFMVIQHPMYDTYFNIKAFKVGDDYEFFLNTSADADIKSQYLFGFNGRQTANAAQALCDALDTQNIDDMYVKYSFFVVGEDESFVINEIPETVAKGTTLVISGVDTANAEKTVQVEMISTAFAAVPKETVGSAAFIVATAEIAEDGTWEVTLDTSDLNVDEYSLSVAIDGLTKKNVNINVVEAADEPVTPPTDKPDEPVTPPQDDAPETPGFGALAALAGLGAVAVLLLRRE